VRSTNQNWAGPLLAKGATATMGVVYEPYLAGTPDLATFTARLIFSGFSYGEAACAAQPVVSWQTTVVGDPLYRPFGRNGDATHQELEITKSPLLAWSWLRLANLNLANGRPIADWVNFFEGLELTRSSPLLTEKLGDLYVVQGKPSSAVHAYSQALKLNPTPAQRLRLLLVLGDRLTASERYDEALESYKTVLNTVPDYPDKLALYRQMEPLAVKLQRKDEAEKIAAEIARLSPPPPKS
jgi:tetratricopeptide (TPR) repeat protein